MKLRPGYPRPSITGLSNVYCSSLYTPLMRYDKGVVLRYLERMTGLSRQQVTRLVQLYVRSFDKLRTNGYYESH